MSGQSVERDARTAVTRPVAPSIGATRLPEVPWLKLSAMLSPAMMRSTAAKSFGWSPSSTVITRAVPNAPPAISGRSAVALMSLGCTIIAFFSRAQAVA